MPSVIASCSNILTLQAYTYGTPFSACIDTGADCNLLTERAYGKLKQLYNVPLSPCANVFQAVQGSPLNVIGSVILPMSFHPQDYTFYAKFYVITNFALQCDALLGYKLLANHHIAIFPARNAIMFDDVLITAMDRPISLLRATSRRVHFEQSPLPADRDLVATVSVPPLVAIDPQPPASAPCLLSGDDASASRVDPSSLTPPAGAPCHITSDASSASVVDSKHSVLPAQAPRHNRDDVHSVNVADSSHSVLPASVPCRPADDVSSVGMVDSAPSSTSPVESKRSVSTEVCSLATVEGEQYIGPTCAHRIPVRVKAIPIGSYVLSQPDSIRVRNLALEGTLSTVRDGHLIHALVTNVTGSPITLKHGVCLGSFTVVDRSLFQDSIPFVAAVSPQAAQPCDSAELATQLGAHVKVLDFPDARSRLIDLLVSHRQTLALPGEPLGVTDLVTHRIDLKPNTRPVYVPSYRLPHSQRKVAHNLVENMLTEGIIQESYSPWNSPMFLVPKKDGSYRAVVDFRRVNDVTVPDHYPLPVLQDLLQSIGKNNTVFSTLDLKSGFWQIPLDENSRHITAFSTPTGHYEWLRCPMGLRNSPLTCQRLINSIFQGLIGDGLFVYLDDLILVSQDLDSHFAKLSLVLQKFADAGLKLNLPKCKFLRARIQFLGHVVDKDGIHTTPDKVKAVQNFPVPKTVNNVRSFLGLAGYYRAFIQDFAAIASPLTRLLKKNIPFQWNEAQQRSFETLKTALTNAPILAFPDYSLPFTICTDASGQGIGAVLMQQTQPRRPHVIAYASRTLNAAESRYSVTHLEALAVVWALKHFRDLIFGYDIFIYTDHTAVIQLFNPFAPGRRHEARAPIRGSRARQI